jgi:hypothetical protein
MLALKEITNNLQISIPSTNALAMMAESPLCSSNDEIPNEILRKATRVLFGLNDENRDDDLYISAVKKIKLFYPLLTEKDLSTVYSNCEIVKIQGLGLTREELLSPIKTYYNSKKQLLSYVLRIENKLNQEEMQEIERKEQEIEFVRISEEKYNEHLKKGIDSWSETIFHAKVIAENLAEFLDKELKAILWEKSLEICNTEQMKRNIQIEERKDQKLDFISENPFNLAPPNRIAIYSKLIVEACLMEKIQLKK